MSKEIFERAGLDDEGLGMLGVEVDGNPFENSLVISSDADKNGLLDKGKFKDFLSNVTNLIFQNKEHNFNETDFEDLFDKYTQSQRLGVGKSEIAHLIEQIFKETKIDDKSTARIEIVEKAVELSKRSK